MYFCKECGNEYKKWFGRCPTCKEYNTLIEVKEEKLYKVKNKDDRNVKVEKLREVKGISENRISSYIKEMDYVLGGGFVEGSLNLIGGSPGVGKSTITMQVTINISRNSKVLYVSGEETASQIKIRADRIDKNLSDNLLVVNLKNLENIQRLTLENEIKFLVIDSIQTIHSSSNISGTVSQLKECTLKLMYFAKENSITILMIGHITKDGEIAGPKLLEHMVDVVLYLEVEKVTGYKLLRSQKNRFGKVGEIGVFQMQENGLQPVVINQTQFGNQSINTEGIAFSMVSESDRIFVSEIQGLTVPTLFGYPKRIVQSYDVNRLNLLLGLMYKRLNIDCSNVDCYLNLSFNLKNNNITDLAVIVSLMSIVKNILISRDVIYLGEVSLTGEVKEVVNLSDKVTEAKRLGFKTIYCNNYQMIKVSNMNIVDIRNIEELKKLKA